LAGGLCKYYAKPVENNDAASTALSAMQAASQSSFINKRFYSTCDKQELQK
jgi:hypothetical protein